MPTCNELHTLIRALIAAEKEKSKTVIKWKNGDVPLQDAQQAVRKYEQARAAVEAKLKEIETNG